MKFNDPKGISNGRKSRRKSHFEKKIYLLIFLIFDDIP